jgi:DNA modification methylase
MCGDSTSREAVSALMSGKLADMVFTDPPYGIAYQDTKGKFDKIENDQTIDLAVASLAILKEFSCPKYICCNWKSYPFFYMDLKDEVKSLIVWDKETRIQNLDKFFKQHEFIIYCGDFGGQKTVDGDVWRCSRETRKDHPTAKPVELIAKAIRYSSEVDSSCIDLFLGSGSTLIACEKTNRVCYGMEIDPHYVDVIIKRWEDFTGKKAEKITGEKQANEN